LANGIIKHLSAALPLVPHTQILRSLSRTAIFTKADGEGGFRHFRSLALDKLAHYLRLSIA